MALREKLSNQSKGPSPLPYLPLTYLGFPEDSVSTSILLSGVAKPSEKPAGGSAAPEAFAYRSYKEVNDGLEQLLSTGLGRGSRKNISAGRISIHLSTQ